MYKKKILFFSVFILAINLLFSGCGASGAKFVKIEKPLKNHGLVYILRNSGAVYHMDDFQVHAIKEDGEDDFIGNLQNGGYLKYDVEEGKTGFWASPVIGVVTYVDIQKDKIYCLQFDTHYLGTPIRLKLIDNELCKEELKSTRNSK